MHYTNPQTVGPQTLTNTPAQSFAFGGNPLAFGRKRQFDRPDAASPWTENLVDRSPTLPQVQPTDLTVGGADA